MLVDRTVTVPTGQPYAPSIFLIQHTVFWRSDRSASLRLFTKTVVFIAMQSGSETCQWSAIYLEPDGSVETTTRLNVSDCGASLRMHSEEHSCCDSHQVKQQRFYCDVINGSLPSRFKILGQKLPCSSSSLADVSGGWKPS